MNRLDNARRAMVIRCLVEGNSIRSTVRMTGVAKNTVVKLLVDLGEACSAYCDQAMRNLTCQRLQLDEIWSFCGMKEKNVPEELKGTFGYGDVWTWTAIDAQTKLVPCWLVGARNGECAKAFVANLASRLERASQFKGAFNGLAEAAAVVSADGEIIGASWGLTAIEPRAVELLRLGLGRHRAVELDQRRHVVEPRLAHADP